MPVRHPESRRCPSDSQRDCFGWHLGKVPRGSLGERPGIQEPFVTSLGQMAGLASAPAGCWSGGAPLLRPMHPCPEGIQGAAPTLAWAGSCPSPPLVSLWCWRSTWALAGPEWGALAQGGWGDSAPWLGPQPVEATDDAFWDQFWADTATSVQDVFALVPAAEIRAVREESPSNLATLCYKVTRPRVAWGAWVCGGPTWLSPLLGPLLMHLENGQFPGEETEAGGPVFARARGVGVQALACGPGLWPLPV